MATIFPIAYNTGSTIPGTQQIGSLAIGTTEQDYSTNIGGVKWWASPDLDLQYLIGYPDLNGNHPNPISFTPCYIGFWGSGEKTENSFINLCNFHFNENFTTGNDAKLWLNNNGYWTSFNFETTPIPTSTPTLTPLPTSTPTPLPTSTPTPEPTSTPPTGDSLLLENGDNLLQENNSNILLDTPTSTSTPTPQPTSTPTPTPEPTSTPTPTPTGESVGSWYFYSDEGEINAGPPVSSGNAIFTISGSPITETFNPNKSSGTSYLYFNVKDSSGLDYTSQFSGYTGGTGTITISQNGDTVTYTSTTPGSFMIQVINQDSFFMISTSACTQTKESNNSYAYLDPISITFGS